jgi:molybdate transport system regulatory protein
MCAMQQHNDTSSAKPYLIRPRIFLCPDLIVGSGKIELLKAVRETGSISAAARKMGMSYKRAWYLLDTLKKGFHQPVFEASPGGRGGGGARLTELGETLIAFYTTITEACAAAADPQLAALAALTKRPNEQQSSI